MKRELKRLIVRRYNKDGLGELVKDSIDIQVERILDEDELRRKTIYVLRNCTEAGFEYLPEDYPWGPGRVYCHNKTDAFKKVRDLGYREQCRLFRTRIRVPPHWEYDQKGMLVPASYIDRDFIERTVFRTPRQYIAFLSVKKKDMAEMEAADARPFLEKKDESRLLREVEEASMNRFGRPVKQLVQADRIALATSLWSERKTTSVKQLARLTRCNGEVLKAIFHLG